MSEQHTLNIPAHPNIYTGQSERDLRIDFSVPDRGVNFETGILMLVPGFGANIESKVYKKMRNIFADKYNLVTIQCEYFGSAYMQTSENVGLKDPKVLNKFFSEKELKEIQSNPSIFLDILSSKKIIFPMKAKIEETKEEFNDMSYMQAIDIVTAVTAVKAILDGNGLKYDDHRVIGYGHSHGAYLLYLSNLLYTDLFSFIIDNSAWMEPAYLKKNRFLYKKHGYSTLAIEFDYIAKVMLKNNRSLNLEYLYEKYPGSSQIISFLGDEDELVESNSKKEFVDKFQNSKFILVRKKDIDFVRYNSNQHGLDADFLELFSYALKFEKCDKEQRVNKRELKYTLNFNDINIYSDLTKGLPVFEFDIA